MKSSRWMAISGAAGLGFFLIANLTDFFTGLNVLAGCIQLALNAFVFLTWLRGFRKSRGFRKLIASFGVFVPPVMAIITLDRILIPAFF
jgi:hypothetical protein